MSEELKMMADSLAMCVRRFGIMPKGLAFEIMTQHLTPEEREEVYRLISQRLQFDPNGERT